MNDDEIEAIAVEHVRWCMKRGDSPAEIMASVGCFCDRGASFDAAVTAIARAQVEMRVSGGWRA